MRSPQQFLKLVFVPGKELGEADPYGVYDAANNNARSALAPVTPLQASRWRLSGAGLLSWVSRPYPAFREMTILADGGGSNGSRLRLWLLELQQLKWNKIEYRLLSFLSLSGRGRPLLSQEASSTSSLPPPDKRACACAPQSAVPDLPPQKLLRTTPTETGTIRSPHTSNKVHVLYKRFVTGICMLYIALSQSPFDATKLGKNSNSTRQYQARC